MDTMKQTAVIMFIISTASVISWIITKEGVPALLAQLILGITHNKYLVLAIINVFLLIVGCLIETVPAMILTIPVLMPIVDAIGVDRVHFWGDPLCELSDRLCSPSHGNRDLCDGQLWQN